MTIATEYHAASENLRPSGSLGVYRCDVIATVGTTNIIIITWHFFCSVDWPSVVLMHTNQTHQKVRPVTQTRSHTQQHTHQTHTMVQLHVVAVAAHSSFPPLFCSALPASVGEFEFAGLPSPSLRAFSALPDRRIAHVLSTAGSARHSATSSRSCCH